MKNKKPSWISDFTQITQGASPGCPGSTESNVTILAGKVTMLPYGAEPVVINSGKNDIAIFDFGIPHSCDNKPGSSFVNRVPHREANEVFLFDPDVSINPNIRLALGLPEVLVQDGEVKHQYIAHIEAQVKNCANKPKFKIERRTSPTQLPPNDGPIFTRIMDGTPSYSPDVFSFRTSVLITGIYEFVFTTDTLLISCDQNVEIEYCNVIIVPIT